MATRAGKPKGWMASTDLVATLAFSIVTGVLGALAFVVAALALGWLSAVAHAAEETVPARPRAALVQYAAFQVGGDGSPFRSAAPASRRTPRAVARARIRR